MSVTPYSEEPSIWSVISLAYSTLYSGCSFDTCFMKLPDDLRSLEDWKDSSTSFFGRGARVKKINLILDLHIVWSFGTIFASDTL